MKKKALPILLILTLFGAFDVSAHVFAQSRENDETPGAKKYVVNLSLWYPISINRTKDDEVNVNLSLLYSRVGYVYGLDISILGSAISHRLVGLQVCGLGAVVGNSGQGAQIAGLACISGEAFSGLQASLLTNITGDSLSGLQFTGLANIAGEKSAAGQVAVVANITGQDFTGFQASLGFNIAGERGTGLQAVGLFNIVGGTFQGLQVGGVANVVGDRCRGGQVAGLFNVTGNELEGFQAGAFNVTSQNNGLQLGIANVGGESQGVQIGVLNYTKEDNTGIPVGAVNIARNGQIRGIAWGGNSVAVNGGVKFMVDRYYSIISLGTINTEDGISASFSYGIHYGLSFPAGRLKLNPDVGYRYRDNEPLFKKPEGQPDQHLLEGRLSLSIPLTERLSLLLGSGIGFRFNSGENISTGKTYPLLFGGLEFF